MPETRWCILLLPGGLSRRITKGVEAYDGLQRLKHARRWCNAWLSLNLGEQGVSKPAGPGDSIMHSRLEADGVLIIASDGQPNYPAKVGENMAIALGGTDKDRLTKIFNDLAEGGKNKMPPTEQPWGAYVGWLTDKFGINWMVNIDKA